MAAVERSAAVHYYQGLNSVAAGALLTKGKEDAQVFLNAFLRVHGAAFCASTLKETQAVLGLVARLVQLLDPSLAALVDSDPVLAQYTSALGPLMTWHTHGSESAKEASTWLKELSSRHPLAVVYVAAAEVVGQRTKLRRAMTASSMEARCAAYGLIGKRPERPAPADVLPLVDEWMARLPPRDLLLAAPDHTRRDLAEVTSLWLPVSSVPDIWTPAGARSVVAMSAAALNRDARREWSSEEVEDARARAATAALSARALLAVEQALNPSSAPRVARASASSSGSVSRATVVSVGLLLAVALLLVWGRRDEVARAASDFWGRIGVEPEEDLGSGRAALAWTVNAAAQAWDAVAGSATGAVGAVSSWLVAP